MNIWETNYDWKVNYDRETRYDMAESNRRRPDLSIAGRYPDRTERMALPGKFEGRVHLNACRTGFMICPGLGPEYGRPYYDDRWGDESDWIDGEAAWDLFKASAAGDIGAIKTLLDYDPGLVNALHWYAQPIHLAVRHGHADATELLLERGADPGLNIFGSTWASLLEDARSRGFVDVAEVVVNTMGARFGFDPAFKESIGKLEHCSIPQVGAVLRVCPNVVVQADEYGNSVLHLAVLHGRKDLIDFFLDRGVSIGERRADGKTPLSLSFDVGFGHPPPHPEQNLTKHLLEKGAHYAVTAASYLGDRDRVAEMLLEDPVCTGRDVALKSPLAYAARGGHEDIASLLLEAGIDGHAVDEALFEAVWHKHGGVVALLLEHGANPNVELDSCGCAAGTDDPGIRDLLVRHGAVSPPSWKLEDHELRNLVKSRSARVRDPYVIAEVLGTKDEKLIDALMADDPEAPSRLEVLQYLPDWGDNAAIARKLVDAGLNPNRRTFQGETYLHTCARQGLQRTALSLIELGARVNALDEKEGWTPLAAAVKNDRTGMIRLLLEHGADPGLADWPWTRPLAIAEEKGNCDAIDLIRRLGGEVS